jgi:hypothetical protein
VNFFEGAAFLFAGAICRQSIFQKTWITPITEVAKMPIHTCVINKIFSILKSAV